LLLLASVSDPEIVPASFTPNAIVEVDCGGSSCVYPAIQNEPVLHTGGIHVEADHLVGSVDPRRLRFGNSSDWITR